MDGFKEYISQPALLDESSLGRVYQHTQGRNIGILTGERGERTKEENEAHNRELEHHIRSAGYGFVHVKGRFTENKGTEHEQNKDEHSYLVIGKKGHDGGELLNFLKKHGEAHGQDSVLHKAHDSEEAHLVGTTHRKVDGPAYGEHMSVGKWHPNRAPEYHSVMRNRKTFAFESFGFYNQKGFFSRAENLF